MRYLFVFLAAVLLSSSAVAATVIRISNPSIRATAPGQDSASLQFSILSSAPARIVRVSSPVAGTVEIHSMTQKNGVMKMHPVKVIGLIPGKGYNLANHGQHVMLLNLKQPLKAGDKVPFTVTVMLSRGGEKLKHAIAIVSPLDAGPQTKGGGMPAPAMPEMPDPDM
jgi:periplasmic copper chaperone A